MKHDDYLIPYYESFDKAVESGNKEELSYFQMFTKLPEDCHCKDFRRRQICENMRDNDLWRKAGYEGIPLTEHGWHRIWFPFELQERVKLGDVVNRGACNMVEKRSLGIMKIANGKWVAEVQQDFSHIGHPEIHLGIHTKQYNSKEEAWNNALKTFIDEWKLHNKGVKKDDEAVARAKGMFIVGESVEVMPMPKGEAIQLSLF